MARVGILLSWLKRSVSVLGSNAARIGEGFNGGMRAD
jgi:hypothetical protein